MSNFQIKPVRSRREKKQFLQFPWKIYQGNEFWIPPIRSNQKELVNYTHNPFYDQAEIQTFLAFRDGEVCGRIAGIVNHAHNERYDEKRGFFGFFESIDDQEVAAGLFDAAGEWLKQHEMSAVRGPINPSLNHECGLLIDGYDSPPTFMITYNHDYYAKLIEAYGFCKVQDLFTFWGHIEMLETLDKKLAFVSEESKRRLNLKLRRMDTSRFIEEVRMFLDIYNKSLVGTWGFTPISDGELKHMASTLRHLIVPEMTTIAEIDGKPIGVVFGLLDYNPRIKKIDGKLFPFGFLRLLWNRRGIKNVRVISTNVIPEYQRWGVGLVLLDRLVPDLLEWGIQEVEFSWVLESNHLSRASLERGGAIRKKTHRIYDLDLN